MNIALFINPARLNAGLVSREIRSRFRGPSWRVVRLLPDSDADPMPTDGSDEIPFEGQDLVISAKPANNIVERSLAVLAVFSEIEQRTGPIDNLAVFGHDGPFRRFTTAAYVMGIELLEGTNFGTPIVRPPALA